MLVILIRTIIDMDIGINMGMVIDTDFNTTTAFRHFRGSEDH